eukprot:CAMPEP_0119565206 /NCGR_PEP_ID=MMETSP1352-20130426/29285_1 /TAXON_ID=265584 /ORGANISM="Stauroneis constricta, Strain CCMP1120" /LENGTH=38 /DNA_ID= /DNA_START= /DNA_END= /DNA_ORIENTATION=
MDVDGKEWSDKLRKMMHDEEYEKLKVRSTLAPGSETIV